MLKTYKFYIIINKKRGVIVIDRIELAINVINLKIAKEVKDNKEKEYSKFKEKITNLQDERDQIYLENEEVINKVLTQYLEEVKE